MKCEVFSVNISCSATLLHSQLVQYLLTEDQLVENGYPRSTKEPGMASINRDRDRDTATPELLPVGPNGTMLVGRN